MAGWRGSEGLRIRKKRKTRRRRRGRQRGRRRKKRRRPLEKIMWRCTRPGFDPG
jgi:hypothetical protein